MTQFYTRKSSYGKLQEAYRPQHNQSWGEGVPQSCPGQGVPHSCPGWGDTPVMSRLGGTPVPEYPQPGLGYPLERTLDQKLGYTPGKDLGPETWERTWVWCMSLCGNMTGFTNMKLQIRSKRWKWCPLKGILRYHYFGMCIYVNTQKL